ncbi:Bro-N domain-containing protein [Candidatus Parcubacteria bacterium]|nr:Bro-N domain-containing protein [Candidatus Parcubacteria bacterium]
MNKNNKLVIFESKQIRRVWHNGEWFFSVVDVVEVLAESMNPKQYLKKLRSRDEELNLKWGTICTPVEMFGKDNKKRKVNATNLKGAFRLIQSISSKKAEPFKMWLAQVGKDRIDEIENPELAQERIKQIYEQKGYPKDWIDKRLRGMAIRQNLTDEWKERGIKIQSDFAILTAEISKACFGMTPSEYKKLKNIPSKSKANLRDNMTDLELIFTMLGERVTTEISQEEKPDTFTKNKKVAKRGGEVAGKARKNAEKEIGKSVILKNNYLDNKKLKKLK